MTPEQIDNATKVALSVVSVAGAVMTTLIIPAAPFIARLGARWLKSADDKLVFDAVTRAVMRGASAGNAALQEAMAKAADPDSPGGKEITHDERVAILAAASAAAWKDACDQGFSHAGEEKVRAAARAKMDEKLRERGV